MVSIEILENYVLSHYSDDFNIDDFSTEDIGTWNLNELIPDLVEFVPDILKNVSNTHSKEIENTHSPYKHLYYLHSESVKLIWACRYCHWWCDIFDQRLMEKHLIINCSNV